MAQSTARNAERDAAQAEEGAARNLTLLTDLYQLTMMSGYLKNGKQNDIAVFDLFFPPQQRHHLFGGGGAGTGDRLHPLHPLYGGGHRLPAIARAV